MPLRRRGPILAVVVAALACGPVAAAQDQTTTLITRSTAGDLPNGPSRAAVISRDSRMARLIAFESDASDLVQGDSNGATDVFAIGRLGPFDNSGQPWQRGATVLVSRGLRGRPANGRSYAPAVDGEPPTPPSCIAFVSEASNLVRGDSNGRADAFVYRLETGKVTRVSVDHRGRQAAGSTFDVAVDGDCERVAFTSDARNLAFTRARGLSRARRQRWAFGRTRKPRRGRRQVYVRYLKGPFRGLTFLASARARVPGNGHSSDPAWAIRQNTSNRRLAFQSTATNLSARDRTRRSDIYMRDLRGAHRTRLVSAGESGAAGNGASFDPAFSEQGFYVAFETLATDLAPGDGDAEPDIVRADVRTNPPAQLLASADAPGPARDPELSAGGAYTVFTAGSPPQVRLYTEIRGVDLLQSRDSNGDPLQLDAGDPAVSSVANYITFETNDPFADGAFVAERHPEFQDDREATYARAASDMSFHQIYMRYVGPLTRG